MYCNSASLCAHIYEQFLELTVGLCLLFVCFAILFFCCLHFVVLALISSVASPEIALDNVSEMIYSVSSGT